MATIEITRSADSGRYSVIVSGAEAAAEARGLARAEFARLGVEMGEAYGLPATDVRPAGILYGQAR